MTNEPGSGGPWPPIDESGSFGGPRSLRRMAEEATEGASEPPGHPVWQRPGDRWSGQLREIDLRDRELTYRDLRYSPGEQPAEVRFDPVPAPGDDTEPVLPAADGIGDGGHPNAFRTFRDPQTGDLVTVSDAAPKAPEAFRPPPDRPLQPGRQVAPKRSTPGGPLAWRPPTQRADDVAARAGQVPLPAWHQGALVVVAALGTGAAAYLLSGDTWGRTPVAVASLIGIPGLTAASLVTAHHRLHPGRHEYGPALAAAAGIAVAAASLLAVWALGTWAALGAIVALVALAWWATSPARGHLDVRDHAGRPMAPAPRPTSASTQRDRRRGRRPESTIGTPHAAAAQRRQPTNLEAMMDVFAPDLPADRTMPALELTPSPAAHVPASGASSAGATGDLLSWIADTYSPMS